MLMNVNMLHFKTVKPIALFLDALDLVMMIDERYIWPHAICKWIIASGGARTLSTIPACTWLCH